jgi:AcrR family transcriptional regulator
MTSTRSPGRPRSETSRQAILAAAIELAVEVGYAGLTIEGIAARAGVGKQTIYRWWPSRADVLLEAGAVKADRYVPVADQGSYRADLRAFLRASYAMAGHREFAGLLRALMAEAQLDSDFGERFRVSFLERRRDALAVITGRARERGDLPERPGADTVADIVFGTIWYRILATRRPLDEAWADDLIAVLAPSRGPSVARDTVPDAVQDAVPDTVPG